MTVFYLHGFASSAASSKAAFFRERLARRGVELHCPDFNEPDFSTLTITRMLEQVEHAVEAAGEPAVLIGSSLGAFVAVVAADRWPHLVDRLVLLAPAVDLRPERLGELGDRTIEQWKATNSLNIFHFGYGRMMPLGYALYEDAGRYDALGATIDVPVQVFQGTRDTAVEPAAVRAWSDARPNVELHMLDDDHQLLASLPYIWQEMERFMFTPTAR
jgi:pimeloyl-ACP methyl ester carboxylesterase